jgi:hypothetical protein
MHTLNETTEETKIEMRGSAESGAVDGGMHVGNVGADGEMNGYGNAVLVRGYENAVVSVFDFDDAAREELPGGFAIANSNALSKLGNVIDVLAGFCGHAELAFAESRFNVFGSVSGEGDFEIVEERSAVHGDSGDETAFHQIDQDRAEADFDDVATDTPDNGVLLLARAMDSVEKILKILGGEKIRERIEKFCEREVHGGRLREAADADLALAGSKRIRVDRTEGEGMNRIDTHGLESTLWRSQPVRKEKLRGE